MRTGPVEPRPDTAKRSVRDFRYPDDLGVFFHPRCAPKVNLPEKMQQEIAKILADALMAQARTKTNRRASDGKGLDCVTGAEVPGARGKF